MPIHHQYSTIYVAFEFIHLSPNVKFRTENGELKLWLKQKNVNTMHAAARLIKTPIIAVRNVKTRHRKELSQSNANADIPDALNLIDKIKKDFTDWRSLSLFF